jgi:hypothetical protein
MVVFCGMHSKSRSPFSSQKTVAMTFPADFSTLNFWGGGSLLLQLHVLYFGLRISVIYQSLVSCHQTLKNIFWILNEQLQVTLDSTGDECPSEKDSAFLGPICTVLGHVQLFMNIGPNCSC